MKLICLFMLIFSAFQSRAQLDELFDKKWMMYPNYDLPNSLQSGDSLFFVVDSTTDYNPEISFSVNRNGRFSSSLTSFSYPTVDGIITSKEAPPKTYTTHSDTSYTGDSMTVFTYKSEDQISRLSGPAACSICDFDMESEFFEFTCGILVRFGANGTLEGPFDYQINENRLILIKK